MIRNKELDNLFCFLMKCYIRAEKEGLVRLKTDIESESEIVTEFIRLSIQLVQDGQFPIVIDTLLTTEIQYILFHTKLSKNEILKLNIVKKIILCIQNRNVDVLLEYSNLWGNVAERYANLTFYPNLPLEVQHRHGLFESNLNLAARNMLEKENY